jgi:hypothetical protein
MPATCPATGGQIEILQQAAEFLIQETATESTNSQGDILRGWPTKEDGCLAARPRKSYWTSCSEERQILNVHSLRRGPCPSPRRRIMSRFRRRRSATGIESGACVSRGQWQDDC